MRPNFAANLLQLLAGVYFIDNRDVHCTASIGLTSSRLSYTSAEQALRDADAAMYHAKAAGKARCVVFDSTMHEAAMTRLDLENDLRQAIGRDQLFLQYQPIVSLSTGAIEGFEALVRWQHPGKRIDLADAIHSLRGGDRIDRADRKMDPGNGMPTIEELGPMRFRSNV